MANDLERGFQSQKCKSGAQFQIACEIPVYFPRLCNFVYCPEVFISKLRKLHLYDRWCHDLIISGKIKVMESVSIQNRSMINYKRTSTTVTYRAFHITAVISHWCCFLRLWAVVSDFCFRVYSEVADGTALVLWLKSVANFLWIISMSSSQTAFFSNQ